MAEPYLDKGEAFIATAHRISVDFVLYDMMLTTGHLILVDNSSLRFELRKIPLRTILSVAAGKVTTGEPVITLSFSGEDDSEPLPSMNLFFTQQAAEQRKRERDEWIRKLMEQIVAVRHSSEQPVPPREDGAGNQERGPQASTRGVELPVPYKSVIGIEPAPVSLDILPEEPDEAMTEEVAPLSPVVEPVPETIPVTSPEDSRTSAYATSEKAMEESGIPEEDEMRTEEPAIPPALEPEISEGGEMVQTPPIDLFTAAAIAVQESTLDSGHSRGAPAAEDLILPAPVQTAGLLARITNVFQLRETENEMESEGSAVVPPEEIISLSSVVEESVPAQEQPAEPVILYPESQTEETTEEPVSCPEKLASPAAHVARHPSIIIAAIIIIVILLAGGIFYSASYRPSQTLPPEIPVITALPAESIPITSEPVTIPPDGLWLRVSSNTSFVGYFGNPGNLQHIGGSGDRFYKIPDDVRLVQVSFQKRDYSGEILAIGIYRNGTLITSRSTRVPGGSIDFIIDPETGGFPSGIPTRI
ncbi:MAG: hypothetical protein A4E35_02312 [Methanoregula sp. PtaU1.Bin051]|nr:MAG: hypothetical protein A4E35_02312 [Methanoregula sp. PtaU1.Bin051]